MTGLPSYLGAVTDLQEAELTPTTDQVFVKPWKPVSLRLEAAFELSDASTRGMRNPGLQEVMAAQYASLHEAEVQPDSVFCNGSSVSLYASEKAHPPLHASSRIKP